MTKMKKEYVKPYDRRETKAAKKAIERTVRSVRPVAKDANKTRRPIEKPTKGGNR